MTMISYAQNFEDVMLWRALKHVDSGFYIDVGANDPLTDSVTKAFYDKGWHGINVEPVKQWFDRLQTSRPKDINLQLAAGSRHGESVIYELPDTGLSTFDKATAERHEAERGFRKIERTVPVETLTSICRRLQVELVHFLKIDVEGAEQDVLSGFDLSAVRPWIIVVESTLPMTQIEDHRQWESLLFSKDYERVYFDGLNGFYVSREHQELKAAFLAPPNVFDDFVLSGTQTFCSLQAQRAAHAEARAREQERRALEAQRLELAIRRSLSWRLTTPFRMAVDIIQAVARHAPGKTYREPSIRRVVLSVLGKPRLVAGVQGVLRWCPPLHAFASRKVAGIVQAPQRRDAIAKGDLATLTPRARRIYQVLRMESGCGSEATR